MDAGKLDSCVCFGRRADNTFLPNPELSPKPKSLLPVSSSSSSKDVLSENSKRMTSAKAGISSLTIPPVSTVSIDDCSTAYPKLMIFILTSSNAVSVDSPSSSFSTNAFLFTSYESPCDSTFRYSFFVADMCSSVTMKLDNVTSLCTNPNSCTSATDLATACAILTRSSKSCFISPSTLTVEILFLLSLTIHSFKDIPSMYSK
mmetsp:Transcript_15225/g.19293  ORF Transcript_15225/g.19293 Transcript_15225/m.19293 type:complete len:203 (-) Transcript_15225:489-1097(-)